MVLVFYPFTFTGVCEGELCELRDDLSQFETDDAQVLALSCDTRHSQRIWAEQQGFNFPVLSDFWPHGAVAKAYGVFNDDLGCANRATFVIDKEGKVGRHLRVAGPRHATRQAATAPPWPTSPPDARLATGVREASVIDAQAPVRLLGAFVAVADAAHGDDPRRVRRVAPRPWRAAA